MVLISVAIQVATR